MAARTDVAALAGQGQPVLVRAQVAAEAREPVVEHAEGEVLVGHLRGDGPPWAILPREALVGGRPTSAQRETSSGPLATAADGRCPNFLAVSQSMTFEHLLTGRRPCDAGRRTAADDLPQHRGTTVPCREAQQRVARATQVGVPHRLGTMAGQEHAAWNYVLLFETALTQFLNRWLKP